ncbi:EFR1 family ferrodoxin [Chloroflexota bacterium]
MKGIVVYYSGTGNNHKVARAIGRGMKRIISCDVAPISDINPQDMEQYDLIGIGSPIWCFRETANTRLFIYNLPAMAGKLSFIFSVHGTKPAGIFHSMVPQIQRKGLTIIGWNDWFGSNYYVLHSPKPYPLDGHPDVIDLEEAENWGEEMAERAQRIYAGEKDLIPQIPRGPKADPLFQPQGAMALFGNTKKPHRKINTEKCRYPECTLCVDNCVAKALDFSVEPPAYNSKTCINCCLCERMCPQGAVEIPGEELCRMRTMKRINMEKCKYPECTVCLDHCTMNAIDFTETPPVFKYNCEGDDLCWVICPEGAIEITNLDLTHRATVNRGVPRSHIDMANRLAAEGRLRRLVPAEDVGSDDYIMDMNRHPRFDINELMQETPLPPDHGRLSPESDR